MVIKHKKVTFDVKLIAKSLFLTEKEVIDNFKDGRVSGRFAEIWCARLFGTKDENYNNPIYDSLREDSLGDMEISIKIIGKSGVKFQRSKNIGSGRSCSREDLIDAIKEVDYFIIVDVQDFPEVYFIPIKSKFLLGKVLSGNLTRIGWKREQVYTELTNVKNGWKKIKFKEETNQKV